MFAGNGLTFAILGRASQVVSIASIGRFSLGMLLGTLAVSTWQQFCLTFGLDPIVLLAIGLFVLPLAFWTGERWSRMQSDQTWSLTLCYLVCCLSAWSLLHPFWIDTLTIFMKVVPIASLESSIIKPLVALSIALMAWLLPGMLWAALWHHGCKHRSPTGYGSPAVALGMSCGLLLNAVVLAPWLGVFVPTIAASLVAIVTVLMMRRSLSVSDTFGVSIQFEGSTQNDRSTFVRTGMIFLIGGLLACHMRLINQLMPHGMFVMFVEVAGVFAGIAFGGRVNSWRQKSNDWSAWSGLFAAAVSSVLIAAQPSLVDLSIWMNARLTDTFWLMSARVLLLMLTTIPFGMAFSGIADSTELKNSRTFTSWAVPLLAGSAVGTFILGATINLLLVMGTYSGLLLAASCFLKVRSTGWVFSRLNATIAICMLAVALSLPAWRFNDDASRTAKILFSTPAFVAYRSGWDVNQLSALDDLRLIHRQESASGSLTLWRGHVAELYVREAGIPRSVLTKNPEIVPQFAPEVLQAVYSLVISERPGRVMLLGLSAGVPLSTCLEFPVREVVCVEGDTSLIDLIRGPISRETGYDPLTDDRVTLKQVAPELALMAKPTEPYDVILSSPPSSSIATGAAYFTTDFYRRASSQLADRGLFCQRFECIDYGPGPLQIVLKSMRQAFQQVIAIETAAGELLLFGANSEDVFIPSELASRIELPHVLRILARCGLDWSTLLNQPAYDHEALGEICGEGSVGVNSTINGILGAQTPLEVMRWGNKQQEVQTVLTTTRLTKAPFWTQPETGEPKQLDEELHLSRRSRLVEWLGDSRVSLETIRRLNEVTTQQKLVHENPDAHWWEYRKALRLQLQDRPRTAVQQVKAVDEKPTLHPEDVRRRNYFVALGNAVDRKKTPTRSEIAAVEEYLEPHDPLLSYFARQEIADLLARCQEDAARELAYRLHVIFFAPTRDASVRNVAAALETLVKHPEAIPDDSARFDALNGLMQTLRTRWETRQFISETSTSKVLQDVDQSLIAIEKGVSALDELATPAGVSETEWKNRRQVIERLLLRPLRTYRAQVKSHQTRSQMQARAIFDKLNQAAQEE